MRCSSLSGRKPSNDTARGRSWYCAHEDQRHTGIVRAGLGLVTPFWRGNTGTSTHHTSEMHDYGRTVLLPYRCTDYRNSLYSGFGSLPDLAFLCDTTESFLIMEIR